MSSKYSKGEVPMSSFTIIVSSLISENSSGERKDISGRWDISSPPYEPSTKILSKHTENTNEKKISKALKSNCNPNKLKPRSKDRGERGRGFVLFTYIKNLNKKFIDKE
jgi:hypothetical protein